MRKENIKNDVLLVTNINLLSAIEYLNRYIDDLKNNETKITEYDKDLFKTLNNISDLLLRY